MRAFEIEVLKGNPVDEMLLNESGTAFQTHDGGSGMRNKENIEEAKDG